VRASNGTTPTAYTYTGQYSNMGDFGVPALDRYVHVETKVTVIFEMTVT